MSRICYIGHEIIQQFVQKESVEEEKKKKREERKGNTESKRKDVERKEAER